MMTNPATTRTNASIEKETVFLFDFEQGPSRSVTGKGVVFNIRSNILSRKTVFVLKRR
jgi:hypothetical protein